VGGEYLSERKPEASGDDTLLAAPVLEKKYDAAFKDWDRQYKTRILLSDDLEASLLKWTKTATGNGDSVLERSTSVAFDALASLHMKSRTTSAAEDDSVMATRTFPIAASKAIKFRVPAWRFEDVDENKYVIFHIEWYDGANYYHAAVRYDVINQAWDYLNSANDWSEVIATHILAAETWHSLELDIDFVHTSYLRLLVDDRTNVFSSTLFYTIADAVTLAQAIVSLETTTQGATPAEAYFDGAPGDPIAITEISEA